LGGGSVTQANFKKIGQAMAMVEAERIMGPAQRLQGAELQTMTQTFPKSLGALRNFEKFIPRAEYYYWTNGKEYYFVLVDAGKINGSIGPSLKGRD
jgi:hypothetical protein